MASPMIKCNEVTTDSKIQWKSANEEGKKVVVEQEMKRMLIMSIQRSSSQEEELELLFAGLSL